MGKWSLSARSLWVDHVSLDDRVAEESVRSIAEKEPCVELRWVGVPGMLSRVKFVCEVIRWSNMLPFAFEWKLALYMMPQVGLWASKSPHITNGWGKDWIRVVISVVFVLWEGGMYSEKTVIGRGWICGIVIEIAMFCRDCWIHHIFTFFRPLPLILFFSFSVSPYSFHPCACNRLLLAFPFF